MNMLVCISGVFKKKILLSFLVRKCTYILSPRTTFNLGPYFPAKIMRSREAPLMSKLNVNPQKGNAFVAPRGDISILPCGSLKKGYHEMRSLLLLYLIFGCIFFFLYICVCIWNYWFWFYLPTPTPAIPSPYRPLVLFGNECD